MDNWRDKAALTAKEFQQLLGISPTTCYKLLREGVVPSVRLGGKIRIPVQGVRRFLGEI